MTDLAIQTQTVARNAPAATGGETGGDFGAFVDTLLDIVNPLQHLPIVSTLYRSLTGDEISAPARLAGGALFGGPLGVVGAAVNLAVEESTGSDIGEHMIALVAGDEPSPDRQLASLDGFVATSEKAEPNMVAYGDANAMTPDYEYWDRTPREAAIAAQTAAAVAPPATPAPPEAAVASPPAPPQDPSAAAAALPSLDDADTASISNGQGSALPSDADAGDDEAADNTPPPSPEPAPEPAAMTALPARNAWLGAALADAEQAQAAEAAALQARPDDALAHAQTSPVKEAPAWLAAAMGNALDKYQALALTRNLDKGGADAAVAAGGEQP